ncbi:Copper transport outer membrane protein, MctB [Acetoanaerobium noterae]|uniref:Copper transport outer membrane protein, MctB n=1 Tax=Acetoanaerobium noterae TaxID=745369 RepID=A0A1T5CK88_9FIRM|nr:copper transporter [Acetoanaerobium noterae]MBP9499663.1 copper transporter [Acetoanaerobium sp.]SKB59756.1 Copper transport outer membrane protein, MctB [Acetoanaerobium noterae]
MFINIKYFIVTIAAVFFSLGIGIMIGFNLNNSEIFTQQQIKLVDDMDKKLNELRVKNDEMNNQLVEKDKSIEIYNEFVNSYYEDLIKDRLVDKNLLIIQTTGDYFFSDISQWAAISGANIHTYLTINSNNFNSLTIAQYPDLFTEDSLDTEKLFNYIINLTSENNSLKLAELEQLGILKIVSTSNNQEPFNQVVLLGGELEESKEKVEKVDLALARSISSKNIPIVFAEESNANYSSIEQFKNLKISTVDNVDQAIGRISLSVVLSGVDGNYGIKDTASKLFPTYK